EDQRARILSVGRRIGAGCFVVGGALELGIVRGLHLGGVRRRLLSGVGRIAIRRRARFRNRLVYVAEQFFDLRVGRAIPSAGFGRGSAGRVWLGLGAVAIGPARAARWGLRGGRF